MNHCSLTLLVYAGKKPRTTSRTRWPGTRAGCSRDPGRRKQGKRWISGPRARRRAKPQRGGHPRTARKAQVQRSKPDTPPARTSWRTANSSTPGAASPAAPRRSHSRSPNAPTPSHRWRRRTPQNKEKSFFYKFNQNSSLEAIKRKKISSCSQAATIRNQRIMCRIWKSSY